MTMTAGSGIRGSSAKAAELLISSSSGCFLLRVSTKSGRVVSTHHIFTMQMSDAAANLQEAAQVLQDWATLRGASSRQTQRILALLNVDWMRSIPLPPRTYRKVGTPDHLWHRFLFRRHVQHILKWTTRRGESDPTGFGAEVNTLIRERLFTEPKIEDDGSTAVTCSVTCSGASSERRQINTTSPVRGLPDRSGRHISGGELGDSHGRRQLHQSCGGIADRGYLDASAEHHPPTELSSSRPRAVGDARCGCCIRDGSSDGQSGAPDDATADPRQSSNKSGRAFLHLGKDEPGEWKVIGLVRATHWSDATIVTNVTKSPEHCREPEAIEGGVACESQPRAKRSRRGEEVLGRCEHGCNTE